MPHPATYNSEKAGASPHLGSAMKRAMISCLLALLLGFLLFFPETALSCARDGLVLWYRNLVPVLFPFLILSNLIIRLNCIDGLLKLIHPLFHLIWGTSVYGSYAILAGFLFGCPMGAKVTGDLRKQELICQEEARYLVSFVNNLSPAFLITFLVRENLQAPALTGPTLCILYGAPLLTGLVFMPRYRTAIRSFSEKKKASKVPLKLELIDACLFDGIVTIAKMGGYIVMFSVTAGALRLLPFFGTTVRNILSASLEITAGIQTVTQLSLTFPAKYLCLMLLCSFGGICALMQTLSVFPMDRLTIRQYFRAKALTACLCLLFTSILLFL